MAEGSDVALASRLVIVRHEKHEVSNRLFDYSHNCLQYHRIREASGIRFLPLELWEGANPTPRTIEDAYRLVSSLTSPVFSFSV